MSENLHLHCCTHHVTSGDVVQTLEEMDFERGIWNAALYNDCDRVRQLLAKGCDVNIQDRSGYTALHYAARNNHLDMCSLLINSGANVNALTRSGQASPLHRAARAGYIDIVKLLISHGANEKLNDSDGKDVLDRAFESQNQELIAFVKGMFPHLVKAKGQM